ncbi:MAG TPA: efflux transporter outer membrane subunit [Lacibacter sp.]|nr:efflux transporter outer membrane subunit [Lacibacter sp.]HMO88416.1 efflux transporter outer membrane subunit [Lacibacter sp.]HMP85898.1 efflux transporter outer membrane subunit [Lacibacter sp.]
MKRIPTFLLIFIVVLLAACAPRHTPQEPQGPVLPATYGQGSDTALIPLPYKSFFKDPLLLQLLDTALVNNWDLQIALQRIEKFNADVLQTTGARRPRVDAVVGSAIRRYGLYTMDGAGNSSTFMLPGKIVPADLPDYFIGFQSAWEIDLWGKLKNRKKAAVARYLAGREGRNLLLTRLVSEIADGYYELKATDQLLRIIDETIAIQQRAFDIVKAKKEAAVLNELAVKQFEAQLANLLALQKELQQSIQVTENRINFLVGRFPQPVKRDTVFAYNQLVQQIGAGVPAGLLENRPDIRQAALEVSASRADVAAARAAFNPSFNITASLGYQAFRPDLLFNTPQSIAYTLVGGLVTPLVNRSALKAAYSNANAGQLEAMYVYYKTVVQAYHEVYTELQRTSNLTEMYQFKASETRLLSQSVEIAEELFRTGRATYLEVLYAQQHTLKAKMELVEIKKRILASGVNLYRSLGGGWQ